MVDENKPANPETTSDEQLNRDGLTEADANE
jgi:hypothetical protein